MSAIIEGKVGRFKRNNVVVQYAPHIIEVGNLPQFQVVARKYDHNGKSQLLFCGVVSVEWRPSGINEDDLFNTVSAEF